MANVCDVLLEILSEAGVRRVFGIPGDAINGLVDAIRRQDRIDFIQVRHEEAGVFAAGAHAKLTGELGVCVGTAGPGAIHLLNGLYDAKLGHAPVLAITGQVETSMVGTDHHQEVDLYTLFKDVAAFNEVVWRPEQLPRLAALAIRTALGRGAPVHPSLPLDVATETVPGGRRPSLHRPRARMTPCDDDLDRAAELLDRAERPVILAGAGCRDARGSLVALAERIGAPIVRTLRAKDVIPDAHPLCLGGLGLLGTRPAWKAMRGTDPLLMVGTDFPYLDFFPDRVPAIQIEVDDARLGRRYPVDVGLLGHANPTMRALTPRLRARRGEWLEEVRGWMEDWERQLEDEETSTDVPLRPQTVARRLAIWPPTTRSSWPTPGR